MNVLFIYFIIQGILGICIVLFAKVHVWDENHAPIMCD